MSDPRPTLRSLTVLDGARVQFGLLRDPLTTLTALAERGEPSLRLPTPLRPSGRRLVFVFGPERNRAVLSDPETFRTTGQGLSGPRGSALRRIRNGLTRSQGDKHRRLRALLLPRLQRRALDAMTPRIAAIVDEELGRLRAGTRIDLARVARVLSLRVASEILFGIDDRGAADRIGSLLLEFVRRSYRLDVLATRWLSAIPGTPYASLERHAGELEREVRALVAARRRRTGSTEDLLTTLIEACDAGVAGLDEDDLVGQVTLLFGASFETTAQALLFTLLLLAQSPSVARSLRQALAARPDAEGDRAGENGASATNAHEARSRTRPELLEFVVRESLRLLPPVPYTIRIARRDAERAGVSVRRGDRVIVSHFLAHRDPGVFAEPERFLPERWRTARPGPYDYFPFSAAPRLCIGAGFATEVLEQAVAAMVERFDFRLPDGLTIEPVVRVTLGPSGAVPVELAMPEGGFRAARLRGRLGRLLEVAGEPAD